MAARKTMTDINILFVDDDQLVRDFAVETIEYGTNRRVMIIDSGFKAWEYIRSQPEKVDIIIADANIPDMDGLELLDRVKKTHPHKKFVITTSNASCESDARERGADALLTKPYDVGDLFAVVQKFIIDTPPPSGSKVTEFPNA